MQGSLLILLAIFLALALYAGARGIAAIVRGGRADEPHDPEAAARNESDLSVSREILKKFLPLEQDRDGNKLNFGQTETDAAVFFGYYTEAGDISGDYFNYLELDDSCYAIIKCDVAGKGIPAALIMIQVATMFLNYFKGCQTAPGEMRIEKVVYQINDFIETLGLEGRFAAFTLCVFNAQTGSLRFCNAGDNIIHLYDSSEGCIKNITLPQTPAAGILPNSVIESRGGYQVQELTLDHGDILLLYTDGMEEAQRTGAYREELGPQRVYDIVNAVMKRGHYRLHDLHFDFSGCSGGVDELIMALIAVEKLFRCCHDPRAASGEWALVDKKIDAFLAAHFLQYQKYCAQTCAYPDNDLYIYYTHLREDEQYDDLTILGVKRK